MSRRRILQIALVCVVLLWAIPALTTQLTCRLANRTPETAFMVYPEADTVCYYRPTQRSYNGYPKGYLLRYHTPDEPQLVIEFYQRLFAQADVIPGMWGWTVENRSRQPPRAGGIAQVIYLTSRPAESLGGIDYITTIAIHKPWTGGTSVEIHLQIQDISLSPY